MALFLFSWVSKFTLDRPERQFIWLQTAVCPPLEQYAVEKNWAVIQLPVEILPWFYGQKDDRTKLFHFSTKAPYHWDYSHHYNNNSSVVKNLEAYKKSQFGLTIFELEWRGLVRKAGHHCVPVPVHSSCQAFAEYLEEKLANGRTSHCPAELVLPTPSHTNLRATRGLLLPVGTLAPMLRSQQELTFPSRTSSN